MATTNIDPMTPFNPQSGAPGAGAMDLVMTATDSVNGNSTKSGGRDYLLLQNPAGTPYTVTINAVKDPFGATAGITAYSIGAGKLSMCGPLNPLRFVNGSGADAGKYTYQSSNAAVLACPLNL